MLPGGVDRTPPGFATVPHPAFPWQTRGFLLAPLYRVQKEIAQRSMTPNAIAMPTAERPRIRAKADEIDGGRSTTMPKWQSPDAILAGVK
jgi:hypothetical protein